MSKNFKSVKASLIIGILLVSLSAAIVPSSSAKGFGIFELTPYLQFNYDTTNVDNIIPDNPNGSKIDLHIFYQISGLLASFGVKRLAAEQKVQINIQIGQIPDYCMASLTQQTVYATPAIDFANGEAGPTQLKVTFTKNAPYPASVNIPIIVTATVAPAFPWSVKPITQTYYITVSAGYLPIIDVTPNPKYLETSPGSLATIGIGCENIGNGETEFRFEIVDMPAGWTAQMIDSKFISANAKESLSLQVRGPIGFGYHDETETITIRVRGIYYAEAGYTTETDKEFTVTVRSVGFYASAFDAMIIIVLLVVLVLVLFYIMQWRKKSK